MSNTTRTTQKETSQIFSTAYFRAVHNAENPFTQMHNKTVRDASLSFGALGLLTYVFSHKETWNIFPKNLYKTRKEGRQKMYSYFQELIDEGYAARLIFQERANGKFGKQAYGYAFFEVKASKEDIEKVQEEFKKFYRDSSSWDSGNEDSRNLHYKNTKEKKTNLKRKTTTPKGESLSLYDKKQPYMKILTDEEQESFIKYVEAHKHEAENIKAWMMDCAKKKYWLTATPSKEDKVEAHKQLTHWIITSFPNRKDIMEGYNYIEFINGMTSTYLTFGDKNFEKTCEEELAKRKLSLSTDF